MKNEIKLHEVQSRKKRKNLQLNLAKHYHAFHGWTKRQVTPFLLSSPTKKKKKKCLTIYQGIWLPFFLLPTIYIKKKTLTKFSVFVVEIFRTLFVIVQGNLGLSNWEFFEILFASSIFGEQDSATIPHFALCLLSAPSLIQIIVFWTPCILHLCFFQGLVVLKTTLSKFLFENCVSEKKAPWF